jgi:EAL domain-containing protein (putative c-di-GMP-specific phosphodiesterase class I)
MPGLDGLELLRAVRCVDAEVPVVLATAMPSSQGMCEAAEAGALLHLVKPIDARALLHVAEYAVTVCHEARRRAEERAASGVVGGGAEEHKELSVQLDRALEGLAMAYQPIVVARSGELHGYEALLRSRCPTLAGPRALLGAAQHLGRGRELGRAVRAAVAADAAGAPPGVSLFVNVHPSDLEDESLYAASAPLSGIARRVVLEVTERAQLDSFSDLEQRIAALRALGYRIAIDDLGAGYAGLTAMVQLRPDVIKLDMALVRDLQRDPVKQRIVGAMASLCRSMDVRVVAEGVESTEERDALARLDCELMQGFFFGRPAPGFLPATN